MRSQKKFTITNPSIVFWLCLFIVVFFIVVIVLNTVLSEQSPLVMCICITMFVFLPCAYAMMWSKVSKTIVEKDKITVRKWTGIKFTIDINDITFVDWKTVETKMGRNESVLIKTRQGNRLSVGTLRVGFEKMPAYIEANIEQSKIHKTFKTIK